MATYVLADIHDHGRLFHDLLKKISFSDCDKMYILGDVVDRGPDGIALLFEIMDRQNVTFILGKHEDILLRYIRSYGYGVNMRTWGLLGNRATLDGYNALTEAQRRKLGEILQSAPTHATVTVHGQKYYLVHAFPGLTPEEELWARPRWDTPNPYPSLQVIVGHTPTIRFGRSEIEVECFEKELFQKERHMEMPSSQNCCPLPISKKQSLSDTQK